jgi:sulfide:quinone oxidoreductase
MTVNTMDIQLLTAHLSVSPQILVSEMQALSEAGFKSIICNRPDGEGPDLSLIHI